MVGNKIIYKSVICAVLMISVFSCCGQANAGPNRLSDSNNSGSSRKYYSLHGEASDVVLTHKVFDTVDLIMDQNEDEGEKTILDFKRRISASGNEDENVEKTALNSNPEGDVRTISYLEGQISASGNEDEGEKTALNSNPEGDVRTISDFERQISVSGNEDENVEKTVEKTALNSNPEGENVEKISENVVNYSVWSRIRRWFRMPSFCCMGERSARVAPAIDI